MEQHTFTFSLIVVGAFEKVSQFKMPLNSIYNKPFVLMNKNVFLNIAEGLK